jgi:translation initiation factor 1
MKFRGDTNAQTVFSTDRGPAPVAKAPARGPAPPRTSSGLTARLRLETSGRAGKAVTVIYGLPGPAERFKELARELKGLCGAGGTLRQEGPEVLIEVQGDHRPRVAERLRKLGFIVKGA